MEDRGREVKRIACGGNHTVLLLSDGSAYGCGANWSRQVCDASENDDCTSWTPLGQRFKDIACGWDFTVGINEKDEVVSRGAGDKGELGVIGLKRAGSFVKVMKVSQSSRVFASLQNCFVVEPLGTAGGSRVYGWGSNTKCQLQEPKSRVVATPVVVYESNERVVEYAALGKDFAILVDVQGCIVHATGNLPSGFHLEQWTGLSGLSVRCMWTSFHILQPEDGLHSFGNGRHGQLYKREKWDYPDDFKKIAVGSEHGVLLSGRNCVQCWGWGEHGNCGRLTNDKSRLNDYSNVISPLNQLPTPDGATVVSVFGGCATTWFVTDG